MSFVDYSGYTIDRALASVGAGWSSLVSEVFTKLANRPIKVIQVKEKYGGLRIYTDAVDTDDDLHEFIAKIEERSYEMCEVCGAPGKLYKSPYATRCSVHGQNMTYCGNAL